MLVQEICNGIRRDVEGISESGFPLDIFPEKVQELILDLSTYENYNVEYAASSLLSAASTAIGNSYHIVIKGNWVSCPALYMLLVGRPGLGKTPPMNFAYAPIREQDAKRMEEYIMQLDANERQHAGKGEKSESNQAGKPKLKKTVISDFTPEALMSIHYNNLRGIAVVADEILSLFKQAGRYNTNSIIIETLLSAWSGQPLDYVRKTESRPIHIHLPCINIIGSIQTQLITEVCKKEYTANGLTDRFLFVFPHNRKISLWQKHADDSSSHDVSGKWSGILKKLLALECPMGDKDGTIVPKRLSMSEDASDYFYGWYNDIIESVNATDDDTLVESRTMKTNGNAARLALIFQLLRWASGESHKDYIDLISVKAAIRMTEYFEDCYKRIMDEVEKETNTGVDKKELWFAQLPDKFTTKEAAGIAQSYHFSRRTMFYYLDKMEAMNPPRVIQVSQSHYEKVHNEDAVAPCTIALLHNEESRTDAAENIPPKCKSAEVQSANEVVPCTSNSKEDINHG